MLMDTGHIGWVGGTVACSPFQTSSHLTAHSHLPCDALAQCSSPRFPCLLVTPASCPPKPRHTSGAAQRCCCPHVTLCPPEQNPGTICGSLIPPSSPCLPPQALDDRLIEAEEVANAAVDEAQLARRTLDEYIAIGAPVDPSSLKVPANSSISGGGVRKTLQVRHGSQAWAWAEGCLG